MIEPAMESILTSQVGHDRLLLHESVPLATPLVVYVEPSGYCNLKCSFCPHGTLPGDLKKSLMSIDLFKKMIADIYCFPEKIKLLRICGNGEPLTNPALAEMIELAYASGVAEKIELITNAALLTPELARRLPQNLTRLVCSIEGLSADDYQRVCQTNVDFDRLLQILDFLYACRGNCTIHIKIHHEAVTTKENETRFFELFSNKCDEIFVEKLVPMWPQLKTAYSSSEFRWGDDPVIKRKVCAQIFKGVQVQADGEVVPCCVDWRRVNVIGNLHADSLTDIWRGKNLRRLQFEHLAGNKSRLEPCSDCTMNDYCEVDNLDDYTDECNKRLMVEER